MDDVACIAEACTEPRIPSGTTVPRVYTPDAGRAFVERQWSRADNDEDVSLAIHPVSDHSAVGLVVLMLRPQPGVVGIGYWIVPSARSRGYAPGRSGYCDRPDPYCTLLLETGGSCRGADGGDRGFVTTVTETNDSPSTASASGPVARIGHGI